MIEFEDYRTRKVLRKEKQIRRTNGWNALHEDFINNDERQGYHVTYVNGTDDPANSEENREIALQFKLKKLLIGTIENDTITWTDFKMLMRLERNLKLKQTTVDKLITVRQGGLSGIVQRIKNVFGI